MQFGISMHSNLFGGTRSFENVSRSGSNTIFYYQEEEYAIDYKNLALSFGLNLKLSWNWINSAKYVLRQNTSVFVDVYQEEITYTLTNFETGDSNSIPPPWFAEDFQIGDKNVAIMNGIGFGFTNDLVYLRKLKSNWNIGGGIAFNIINRDDRSYVEYLNHYGPNDTRYYFGTYRTKQLGLVFHLEKTYASWNYFLNLNQAVFTTKKNGNKGGDYFPEADRIHPISCNLDYRFPLLINIGAVIQFRKIK